MGILGDERKHDDQISNIEADADQERRDIGPRLIEEVAADPATDAHGYSTEHEEYSGSPSCLGDR